MASYSFKDVTATIDGEGGNFSLKGGIAEEGITIEPTGDLNEMTLGADGEVMHSLLASTSSAVTVRLLKTSPVNQQLMNMCNYQRSSSSRHGTNTITVRDAARGDIITATKAAFKKIPSLAYAKSGGTNEWVFDCGETTHVLGNGQAEIL